MDIMLGNWVRSAPARTARSRSVAALSSHIASRSQAAANLADLPADKLDQFHDVLEMENPDLYKWLTGDRRRRRAAGTARPLTPCAPSRRPQASSPSLTTSTTRCCERSALISRKR